MKRVVILLISVVTLISCIGRSSTTSQSQEQPDMHNAENSIDYVGTYKGTFPAADCPGIEVSLELKDNNKFSSRWSYIDRSTVVDEQGKYSVDQNILTLIFEDENSLPAYYKIGENRLDMLNSEKQPTEGPTANSYTLIKTK